MLGFMLTLVIMIKKKMYNQFYCFTGIYIPDSICRQKVKTQMQIARKKKVNISYTHTSIVLDAAELCFPMAALTYICGQRCTVLLSKKAVSSWKLRKNIVIGCRVTLRGYSALLFLEKLYIYGTLPYKEITCKVCAAGTFTVNFGVPFSCFFELKKSSIFKLNPGAGFYVDI